MQEWLEPIVKEYTGVNPWNALIFLVVFVILRVDFTSNG
jgi:hypothetical protein